MDHLWAGWRTTYVESAAGAPAGEGSPFIAILASGLPDTETNIVWRGRHCFAILNAYPYTNGHLLVMPYREVGELEDLTPAEHAELWAGATSAVRALQAAYRPDGINLGMNLGQAAGAGVADHIHMHVVPRWAGDTNFMTTVGGTRVIPEDPAEARVRLRALLAK